MSGDYSRLSTVKAKMQATIAGIYTAENNEKDCAKKMRAGVIWDDDVFGTLGLDVHCLPLDVVPDDEIKQRATGIFCVWLKDWEEVNTSLHGDAVLEQRILRSVVELTLLILIWASSSLCIEIGHHLKRRKGTIGMNFSVPRMDLMTQLLTMTSWISISTGIATW